MKIPGENKEALSKELFDIWKDTGLVTDPDEALSFAIAHTKVFNALKKMKEENQKVDTARGKDIEFRCYQSKLSGAS